ncbi:Phosphate regulon sensor protein PhoR (SphS) [Thermogutta terrifontis]|jgi:two-component system phosphate regulon sensor histidine kinase PhoR|uniref:histidine kinase n=1 Tax=Thermogutta terrifontis TaxID=1331910 RepID=A0A286RGZ5_9BACT|nr:ATP-binding protein [Thermogutta terrifontis]ASV75239.1 Phosphate regulon sensor protein PhoR (SphS) [Thermogutta terrifontis]
MMRQHMDSLFKNVCCWGGISALLALLLILAVGSDRWQVGVAMGAVTFFGMLALRKSTVYSKELEATQRWVEALTRQLEALLAGKTVPEPKTTANVPTVLGSLGKELTQRVDQLGELIKGLMQAQAVAEIRAQKAAMTARQLTSVLNLLPDPVLVVNSFERVEVANQAARDLLGLDELEADEGSSSSGNELFQELMGRIRRLKVRDAEFDWEADCDNNQHFQFRVLVREWRPDGQESSISNLAIVLEDTSSLTNLRKRHAEFVSAVSHEMKAPLAGIKAYVELLADEDVDETTRDEFVTTIESQIERLQRLIENLLNLARIEAGIMKVKKQNYSLNEILEDAARVMRPHAEQKHIDFQCELSPLYLSVVADRDLLLQAAINLLSNAIKYTPDGGRVVLRSRMEEEYAVFEVEDTGVGLSPEDCQRVFERFYRVESHKNMAPGTGLGLPLTKHIVEDVHGGRIAVRSVVGMGSTFVVQIPRAVAVGSPISRSVSVGN